MKARESLIGTRRNLISMYKFYSTVISKTFHTLLLSQNFRLCTIVTVPTLLNAPKFKSTSVVRHQNIVSSNITSR